MRSMIRIALVLALTAFAGIASAQDSRGEPAPDVSYDFDDDFVTGGTDSPLGNWLTVRPRGQRSSLIRPRAHFVPELVTSIERI